MWGVFDVHSDFFLSIWDLKKNSKHTVSSPKPEMVSFPRIKTHQNFSSQIRQNNFRIGKFENISLCKGNPPDAAQKGGKSQLLVLVISLSLSQAPIFARTNARKSISHPKILSFFPGSWTECKPPLSIHTWVKSGWRVGKFVATSVLSGKMLGFFFIIFSFGLTHKGPFGDKSI